MRAGYVYIMTNKPFGTLYTGVTNDIVRRVYEHKHKIIKGFTQKHNLTMLAYYEYHERIIDAIYREKCIKKWNRNWKLRQIMDMNPDWHDLYDELI